MQVISTTSADGYSTEIASDVQLKDRFKKVDLNGSDDSSDDSFVGDKISPDLREMMANAAPNQKVKVILQSDDINNPELLAILQNNNVKIENRAEGLNMLIIELPVTAAEQIAAVRGAKHLSLDRKTVSLGHIETTTGASLVRSVLPNLVPGLTTQLDGTGIGIAIVDSSVRDDHRSFTDSNGVNRIGYKIDFSGADRLSEDKYGHGTHVASIAAGSSGKSTDSSDIRYLGSYQGIAPNANIINVRVLDGDGVGSSARIC